MATKKGVKILLTGLSNSGGHKVWPAILVTVYEKTY